MSGVYTRSKNLGLTPESIASYLTDFIQFSKTVPFTQISEFIQQKADEKLKLEEEIQKLKDQIKTLGDEKSSSSWCSTLTIFLPSFIRLSYIMVTNLQIVRKASYNKHYIRIHLNQLFMKLLIICRSDAIFCLSCVSKRSIIENNTSF
jgi:hypothetical protein